MTGKTYELYNVDEDSAELNNLADQRSDVVAELSKVLHEWYISGHVHEDGKEIDLKTLDPKAVDMLRSLGYVE